MSGVVAFAKLPVGEYGVIGKVLDTAVSRLGAKEVGERSDNWFDKPRGALSELEALLRM